MLEAAHEVLRGGARGKLADGRRRGRRSCIDLERALEAPRPGARRRAAADASISTCERRARPLAAAAPHRVLELPGLRRSTSAPRDAPRERWRIVEHRDFDGAAIEAAGYGPTVAEAAAGRLLERLARAQRDAGAAAAVLARRGAVRGSRRSRARCSRARARSSRRRRDLAGRRPRRCAPRCTSSATSAVLGTAGDAGVRASCSRPAYDRVAVAARRGAARGRGVEAIARGGRGVRALRAPARARTLAGVLERLRDDDGAAPGPARRGARRAVGARRRRRRRARRRAGAVRRSRAPRRLPVRALHSSRASRCSGART